jgi:excisionase family DNA binding protein
MSTNSEDVPRAGFLGVHEVARLLGCSPRTIYTWVSQGAIPYRKVGRNVRFDEAEVRNWTKPQSDPHRSRILTKRPIF